MARYARFAAPLMVLLVAGTLTRGTGGLARGEGVLKIGAPLAATGADAREGALTKDGYDLWVETVNTRGGIKVGEHRLSSADRLDDQSKRRR